MCHPSVLAFIHRLTVPEIEGKTVIEAGACDMNGSAKGHLLNLGCKTYLGIDLRGGRNVNLIMDAADMASLGQFDVVISTEMLEHVEDWRAVMKGMIDALKPGGMMVLTTRSPGFPFHEYPGDYWRYTITSMRLILKGAGLRIEWLAKDDDPGSPGVFVKAHKPDDWTWPANTGWDDIQLDPPE